MLQQSAAGSHKLEDLWDRITNSSSNTGSTQVVTLDIIGLDSDETVNNEINHDIVDEEDTDSEIDVEQELDNIELIDNDAEEVISTNYKKNGFGLLDNASSEEIADAIKSLEDMGLICQNVRNDAENKRLKSFDQFRLVAVLRYLQFVDEGVNQIKAYTKVASVIYGKKKQNSYKSFCIRDWAAHYVKFKSLQQSQQGKHIKTHSLVENEEFQLKCRELLRAMKDEERFPRAFMNKLHEGVAAHTRLTPWST